MGGTDKGSGWSLLSERSSPFLLGSSDNSVTCKNYISHSPKLLAIATL